MKQKLIFPTLFLAVLGVAFTAQAHDPKEHMKGAESPNCAGMKDMDHSKMDMNDPVMQAMMKQCMKDMDHGDDMQDKRHNKAQDSEGHSMNAPEHPH
jgi:uncharacterized protein involved in copper resistance